MKYSPTLAGLDEAFAAAMAQIKSKHYYERLRNEGRENITAFALRSGRSAAGCCSTGSGKGECTPIM